MISNNSRFQTEDIKLATYLDINNVQLLEIIPHSYLNSTFVFVRPPQQLLDDFLSGNPTGNVVRAIQSYRHLIRDSRRAFEKAIEEEHSR